EAGYSNFGSLSGSSIGLVGTDHATVTGAAAEVLVERICMTSRWSATIKLAAPTSTPMFWNGLTFPFIDGRVIELRRSLPNKKTGLFSAQYSESWGWVDCKPGPNVAFPAIP